MWLTEVCFLAALQSLWYKSETEHVWVLLDLINIVQRPHVNTLIVLVFKFTIDLSLNKCKILQMKINQSASWAKQNEIWGEINKC